MSFIFVLASILISTNVLSQTSTPTPDEHIQYWITTVQGHSYVLVRKNAARELGTLADRRAVPALLKALRDQSYEVRQEATKALGFLGDEQALGRLQEASQKDSDALVRGNAREAIERIVAYQEFQRKKREKLEEKMKP